MSELWVNEIFETIQGEGSWTGAASIFIRLQGCPVGCPWCDTKHTWESLPENIVSSDVIMLKQGDDARYFQTTCEQLFALLLTQNYTAKHVVITGGEPCMYDLNELTNMLIEKGYTVQIETSGTYEVKCANDTWVTVSPKINMQAKMPVLMQAMLRANEIKHPIAMQKHIDELDHLLAQAQKQAKQDKQTYQPMIYIQPISQQKRATDLAVSVCIERNWRLSVQLHKYIGVE